MGSFSKQASDKEVSVQNFAFNSAKKNPNADLAGIGSVGS